jgi:putative addiction module component (TIGR02574 family)
MDRRIDAAWATEVETRIDAYDAGKISVSPTDEVFKRINRR